MTAPIGARYRRRCPGVEAVRLAAETFDRLVRAIPSDWFYGAHNGEGSEAMQLLMRIYPGASDWVKVIDGDWVTVDAHGEWSAFSPEEFAKRYEIILDGENETGERS